MPLTKEPVKSLVDLLGSTDAGFFDLPDEELCKLYRKMLGESLAQTITRRRTMKAAYLLLYRRNTLAEIADLADYRSKSALIADFRQIMKIDPEAYRDRGRLVPSTGKATFETLYRGRIVNLPPRRVVGVLHLGDKVEGYKTFNQLYLLLALQGIDFRLSRRHTLFHDDPFMLPPHAQSADCCITLSENVRPLGNLRVFDLPSGPHAVVLHRGPYIEMEQAHFWLTRWWIPAQGLKAANSAFTCTYLSADHAIEPEDCLTEVAVTLEQANSPLM